MAAAAAVAEIGHNNPPDPFTAIKVHIDDLMTEARNWCDGAPVETQAQADEVSRLVEMFREARDAADRDSAECLARIAVCELAEQVRNDLRAALNEAANVDLWVTGEWAEQARNRLTAALDHLAEQIAPPAPSEAP